MIITETSLKDVYLIEPKVLGDHRGYFFESFRDDILTEKIRKINWVQDNESLSVKSVLRGLHYQLPPFAQTKLVRIMKGRVLDVAVDIRKGSPNFGKHIVVELSDENKKQLFIPRGFAHGFVVLSDTAVFSYKVDNYYSKEADRSIRWNDPEIGVDWQVKLEDVQLSEKDIQAKLLKDSDLFTYTDNLYA